MGKRYSCASRNTTKSSLWLPALLFICMPSLFAATITFTSDPAATPNLAEIGQDVNFFAVATDSDGYTLTYTWNFGDGSIPVTGSSVSYAYAAAGNYSATVTVSDGNGAEVTGTVTITVMVSAKVLQNKSGTTTRFVYNFNKDITKPSDSFTITISDNSLAIPQNSSNPLFTGAFIYIGTTPTQPPSLTQIFTSSGGYFSSTAGFVNGKGLGSPPNFGLFKWNQKKGQLIYTVKMLT